MYFISVFGIEGQAPIIIVAVGLPVILCVLNLIGVKEATRVTSVMVLIKVFAIVLLLMFGGYFLFQHFDIVHYKPFFPNGFSGTLNGSAVIFLRFLVSILLQ